MTGVVLVILVTLWGGMVISFVGSILVLESITDDQRKPRDRFWFIRRGG